jgi:hypothetical protein
MTEEQVKKKIEDFRDTYVKSYNSPSTQMDLREHFYLVRDESKTIHELMALMYDETHKILTDNKNQILTLMDKAIQADTELYNYLLTIEKNKLPKTKPSIFTNIKELFSWSNIFKFLFLLSSVLFIMFLMYELDPEAYTKISSNVMEMVDKFKK